MDDKVGSLYIDNTTGITYRLTAYIMDIPGIMEAEKEAERSFTAEEAHAFPLKPRYSMLDLQGFAGQVNTLPDLAMRIWQPID